MTLKQLSVFLFCFMFSGCWFSSHPVPIPPGESQFLKPVQEPFKFSAPGKFKWKDVPADSIHPGHIIPWWFSWWAELLYFLIFMGLLRLWVRQRFLRLLNENAWLEQKVAERTEALSQSLENLRQTQTQLIQAEKMASLGELTAGIAHEIQNPLNFVNNFSEVNTELILEADGEIGMGNIAEARTILKDIRENEQKINHHGKRADAIVKGMLQHSQSGSGAKELININGLADEYLRLAYHGLRGKDNTFSIAIETEFDKS